MAPHHQGLSGGRNAFGWTAVRWIFFVVLVFGLGNAFNLGDKPWNTWVWKLSTNLAENLRDPHGQPKTKYTLPVMDNSKEDANTQRLLSKRASITTALQQEPYHYDLILYLERAAVHGDLRYPDLAAGDAYRALLLCDECTDESFEYHEQALDALRSHCISDDNRNGGRWQIPVILMNHGESYIDELSLPSGVEALSLEAGQENGGAYLDGDEDEDTKVLRIVRMASLRCYHVLAISLMVCGSLKSAYEFCLRGLAIEPEDEDLLQALEYIHLRAKRRLGVEEFDITQLPDQGLVRREVYPWNEHEPDRFSAETLAFLNKEMETIAPKCEVRVTELPVLHEAPIEPDDSGNIPEIRSNKQLGLFAKEDIAPGEELLDEISFLAANNVFKDSLCDACSSELPPLGEDCPVVGCPDCEDIMFCNEDCLSRALETYHPAVCDKDIDAIAKDVDPKEKPFALYLLLLGRALAMSTTMDVHPLDLKEVKYIWGDFLPTASNAAILPSKAGASPTWTLPFSFSSNISGPLHTLEKMDIDVFSSIDHYDLWIFNTLYAKFRGTASARVNHRTGHPEVAAVHPLWCLGNHDCDPNVKWEWGARMRFWCRETRVGGRKGGIKKGDEILNHYTDIDLPVKERREWAKGSLGGFCMCGRCRREAGEDVNCNGDGIANGV
ncbi:Uncharacterized protein BP5553_00700 [Venustampulla echinocandica]|uniref:SET domain-containing protein n=1 Tax=Venustampulla echinocandica TaxID=2656787 RepID=A0A370TYX2_9HELO|nr:Uncharacterized protein BP5553_00700 [Venustampulla echinocandica]RDL40721.1 Uncharacterized protein BP5553_00700 [Venustampulla echinocandica]